jgi:hypothetical protein
VLQIANGNLPNPFKKEDQSKGGWIAGMKRMVGIQEEEKKEDPNKKIFKFKKIDVKLEFSPEEVIMFYV